MKNIRVMKIHLVILDRFLFVSTTHSIAVELISNVGHERRRNKGEKFFGECGGNRLDFERFRVQFPRYYRFQVSPMSCTIVER